MERGPVWANGKDRAELSVWSIQKMWGYVDSDVDHDKPVLVLGAETPVWIYSP